MLFKRYSQMERYKHEGGVRNKGRGKTMPTVSGLLGDRFQGISLRRKETNPKTMSSTVLGKLIAGATLRFLASVVLVFFLYNLLPTSHNLAFAQTETATLSGVIQDPRGGVVPDTEVTVTRIETGTVATTRTNGAGIYVFTGLIPGRYHLILRKPGFKEIAIKDFELHVQDKLEQNFSLEIGSISETVTVEAGGLVINTTDASVSTVVDQSYVKNMPLNGRSFQDLIMLTPGVVTQTNQQTSPTGSPLGQTGEFSVNGQRTESNNYSVDGVAANVGAAAGANMTLGAGPSGSVGASTALGTTQALVSVDDLQEFRVQSSTYSAEYGRNPGGQFAFETKSGTNQWHGTAYDYLRNGFVDAQDWFNDYFGTPEPDLRQNDFGGTLGGPIEIPHLYNGEDKTFFFISYEGLRLTAPQGATANFVPDAMLRASAPAALQPLLNAFPVQSPNGIDDTANGTAQFIGSWSNPSSLDSTSVRFDHIVNDKLRLFFRFSDTASSSAARGAFGFAPTLNTASTYIMRTYTGGVSSVLSNRISNEFRLNYSSNAVSTRTFIDPLGGSTSADLAQLSGLDPGSLVSVFLRYGGYDLTLNQSQSSGAQRQWNLVDSVNVSMGRHQFKFGLDYRRLAPLAIPSTPSVEYFYLSQSAVETNGAFTLAIANAPAYPLYTNVSAFAQDEWRVSPRLSLSVGLRWEVDPAPGVTQGLKPYTVQGSGPDTWVLAPQGTPLWHTTWFNFAPRLGAAYILRDTPGWVTVVRGGGGVFFDTGQQLGSTGFQGPGFEAFAFNFATPQPFPSHAAAPPVVNPPVGLQTLVYGFAPHLQLPYTLQWNASIEQILGRSQAFTVSYVGSHAARLLQQNQFSSSTNPNISTTLFGQNGLTSDYNSLQLQFRRNLTRGLTALASYTWSHCIDYGSENYTVGYQRGNCDFDVRHNFSTAFSYNLPDAGHGKFANTMLRHWGLDDRFTARTAFPVTLQGNALTQPNGQLYYGGLNLVPGQRVYLYGANCTTTLQSLGDLAPGHGCPGGRAINPSAFTEATSGLGDAPRNFVRGFGAWQMDTALRREFPIHEGLKLQFRAEAFNIFNHPNFGRINSRFGQATFGQATGTLANSLGILSPLYQQGGPRSLQFSLKLVF
jgi:hypothetical protein